MGFLKIFAGIILFLLLLLLLPWILTISVVLLNLFPRLLWMLPAAYMLIMAIRSRRHWKYCAGWGFGAIFFTLAALGY